MEQKIAKVDALKLFWKRRGTGEVKSAANWGVEGGWNADGLSPAAGLKAPWHGLKPIKNTRAIELA